MFSKCVLISAHRVSFLTPFTLQETFRNEVSKEEWVLIKNLKAVRVTTSSYGYPID
jgi:hypothetical protein